ncbi:hypothetical protein [Luteimicrobium subarcticum]|uniref:Uncharacterized protein n=1 Tax=Luteimicrobium subarcticum TaxID=620910 RepID=A0A2M8WS43_9MICO|nr:hypothetical protein [Luteimicrobium subarcticum]PJI93761.1 hypothetical protein CLV34_1236 [Luteimicrobium subarcticum]
MGRVASTTATVFAALGGFAVMVASALTWVLPVDGRSALAPSGATASSLLASTYQRSTDFTSSAGIVLLVTGALTTVGAIAGSRAMTALFAALSLIVGVDWLVSAGSAYDGVAAGHLAPGGWLGLGGAAVALVCSFDVRRNARGLSSTHGARRA